jgi:hypothetical protein
VVAAAPASSPAPVVTEAPRAKPKHDARMKPAEVAERPAPIVTPDATPEPVADPDPSPQPPDPSPQPPPRPPVCPNCGITAPPPVP